MTNEKLMILRADCPECGAKAGQWCVTSAGQPRSRSHHERQKVSHKMKDIEAKQEMRDPIKQAADRIGELEAENKRISESRNLAYGLLWTVVFDNDTPEGRACNMARRSLLLTMTKADQSVGITAARKKFLSDTS